jgi:hypothetical protein
MARPSLFMRFQPSRLEVPHSALGAVCSAGRAGSVRLHVEQKLYMYNAVGFVSLIVLCRRCGLSIQRAKRRRKRQPEACPRARAVAPPAQNCGRWEVRGDKRAPIPYSGGNLREEQASSRAMVSCTCTTKMPRVATLLVNLSLTKKTLPRRIESGLMRSAHF